jgi:hypothetical protein
VRREDGRNKELMRGCIITSYDSCLCNVWYHPDGYEASNRLDRVSYIMDLVDASAGLASTMSHHTTLAVSEGKGKARGESVTSNSGKGYLSSMLGCMRTSPASSSSPSASPLEGTVRLEKVKEGTT